MKNTTMSKYHVNEKHQASEKTDESVDRIVVYAVAAFSIAIGLFGAACFVGGLINSGGPISLVKDWFRAISGI